jgi:quercetin dioxygenase-like cupin family protein
MTGTPEGRGLLPAGHAESLAELLHLQPHAIVSRVIARAGGGSVTLFAIDESEGLSEHTSPFDALAIVLDGRMRIQIADTVVAASAGQVVRLPGNVPHALQAEQPSRMLLIMLR